jgi:hypothetical protein
MSSKNRKTPSRSGGVQFDVSLFGQQPAELDNKSGDFEIFSASTQPFPSDSASALTTTVVQPPSEPQTPLFFGTPKRKSALELRTKTPQRQSSNSIVVYSESSVHSKKQADDDFEDDDQWGRPPGLQTAQDLAKPLPGMSSSSLERDLDQILYPSRLRLNYETSRASQQALLPAAESSDVLVASSGRYQYGQQRPRRDADAANAVHCILVFGFPPSKRMGILSRFDHLGSVTRTFYNESSNWMGIEYENAAAKLRALSLNGSLVHGVVVGVKHVNLPSSPFLVLTQLLLG